jgi:THO complex subunit 4
MKVEIALDPSQLQSLASRVSAPPAPRNASGPGAGAGRGRGGRGGGKPRTARPKPKTAEELDAEMSVSNRYFRD